MKPLAVSVAVASLLCGLSSATASTCILQVGEATVDGVTLRVMHQHTSSILMDRETGRRRGVTSDTTRVVLTATPGKRIADGATLLIDGAPHRFTPSAPTNELRVETEGYQTAFVLSCTVLGAPEPATVRRSFLVKGGISAGDYQADKIEVLESCLTAVEVVVGAEVESFDDAVVTINQYVRDPVPMDTGLPVVELMKVRGFSHAQGDETRRTFWIGGRAERSEGFRYAVYVSVYRDGAISNEGQILSGETEDRSQAHVLFRLEKTCEGSVSAPRPFPRSHGVGIAEMNSPFFRPDTAAALIVVSDGVLADFRGLSPEAFEAHLKTCEEKAQAGGTADFPTSPVLPIFFEVTNVGQGERTYRVGEVQIHAEGRPCVTVTAPSKSAPVVFRLQPGERQRVAVPMISGTRRTYFPGPGTYVLRFSLPLTVEGSKHARQTLESCEVRFRVK